MYKNKTKLKTFPYFPNIVGYSGHFRNFVEQTNERTGMERKTPGEVAETVRMQLRLTGTISEAAADVGMARSTLCNLLNGKQYMTAKQARKLADRFGFAVPFLTAGVGDVYGRDEEGIGKDPDGMMSRHTQYKLIFDFIAEAQAREEGRRSRLAELAEIRRIASDLVKAIDAYLAVEDVE